MRALHNYQIIDASSQQREMPAAQQLEVPQLDIVQFFRAIVLLPVPGASARARLGSSSCPPVSPFPHIQSGPQNGNIMETFAMDQAVAPLVVAKS